ncbi:glycosyl hydrolase family 28-related protein [Paraburkholderia sediminicola]|uniref:glycosyl hydrolase family 28-related protein n=1 Tax=Paraburkholderia sediminicola TaxID=458836 RepID=UPI0038B9A525
MKRINFRAALAAFVLLAPASHSADARVPADSETSGPILTADNTLTPMRFGATGDRSADDTAALNAMYVAARKTTAIVFLRGGQYRVTGQIDARGVRTIGEGATLNFELDSSTSPNAFLWGGSNTFVTQVNFRLANSGAATMQGVLNPVNDVRNERFYGNRVECVTTDKSNLKSNIFGVWVTGTGVNGLYINDNEFESCTYGVQINSQNGMQQNVRTNPLGKPSSHIHISDNTFVDATLGVNTPHILVSDVVIAGNTIEPKILRLDLPLNVAHVSRLAITGNTVTSNASSANGTLHVEDASGAVTITGNVITVKGKNNGIQVGVRPSVSHDQAPTGRVVISGNHVEGPGGSIADTAGIIMPDGSGTIDTTVSGNYIADFAQCVNSVERSNVSWNTLVRCPVPVKSVKSPMYSNMINE